MAGPNHIVPITPEIQDQLPVWDKMDALTGKVVDRRRRVVMGTLAGLALALSNPAMAQDMIAVKGETSQAAIIPNPEFDRIISDAQKAGKDPLDYSEELRKAWKLTFTQWRELRKYYSEITAISRRTQEAQIDSINTSRTATINATAIKLISSLEKNRRDWTFKKTDLDTLKEIYNRPDVRDDVKKMIQEKFWDLFDFRTLIAQA